MFIPVARYLRFREVLAILNHHLRPSLHVGLLVFIQCLSKLYLMHLKKSILLSTQSGSSLCWHCLLNQQRATQATGPQRIRPRLQNHSQQTYATVAPDDDPRLRWPEQSDPRRLPTPYQIFNQQPDEAYSKRRFYELVKIYHPDRNSANVNERGALEEITARYRLVIAANAILSSPERRSAYDRLGAGWSHYREDSDMNGKKRHGRKYSTYDRWREEYAIKWGSWSTDGDPMYNATWEDWERWYERQRDPEGYARRHSWNAAFFSSRGPQSAVFANNYVFLSVIALFAALGGIGQATRMNQLQENRQSRIKAVNEQVGRDLLDVRNDARDSVASAGSKKDRIRRWVQQREGYGQGEPDGRMARVSEQDFCGSEMIKDKDEVPFWKRPPEEWER